MHEHRIATRYQAGNKGRLEIWSLKKICHKMAFEMMHSNKWQVSRYAESLCERHTHYKSTHQTQALLSLPQQKDQTAKVCQSQNVHQHEPIVSSKTPTMASVCLRLAISGTTPPKRA